MKKLVMSLVLGASLAIVPSAFALKAMTADNMKDTTGQAGVSIAADDIIIYSSAGTTTYTDTDDDASIVIQQVGGTLTTIRAIFDDTQRGTFLQENYSTILSNASVSNIGVDIAGAQVVTAYDADTVALGFIGKPITIDVTDSLTILTAALRYKYNNSAADATALPDSVSGVAGVNLGASVVGVVIGLPTVEIAKSGTTKKYSATADGGVMTAVNSGREYIQITKTDSYTAILGGTIEIAPH